MTNSSKHVRIQLMDGTLLKIPPGMIESATFPRVRVENHFRRLVVNPGRC